MKSAFKRTITCKKYQSKVTVQAQSWYLDYFIDQNFQSVNGLFVLSFADGTGRKGNKKCFLPNVQIDYYNVMIDGQNLFDQPVKSDKKKYDYMRKIGTGQGDDYTTGCLLDYPYFKQISVNNKHLMVIQ